MRSACEEASPVLFGITGNRFVDYLWRSARESRCAISRTFLTEARAPYAKSRPRESNPVRTRL